MVWSAAALGAAEAGNPLSEASLRRANAWTCADPTLGTTW